MLHTGFIPSDSPVRSRLSDDSSILILEPHPDVRDLIAHVVEHVGHEPVLAGAEDGEVDAIVLEPESPSQLAIAQEVLDREIDATVVCVSIGPASPASRALAPVAHVIKPFGLTS